MSSLPGTFGRYRIIRRLGSGGMGEVWFAVSPTAEPVALKVIRPHLVEHPTIRERFAAEVENLKMVFGSRIARLENADPLGDPAWLAVEYVPGPTLKSHVERHGPLPVDLAAMVGAMLAEGLAIVHQSLLHRDLKPQNVILGPNGPMLIDFGLAVLAGRDGGLTESGVPVGTPAYMAPEQARGEGDLGSATDVYGLGATLVFALTGHTLYPPANALLVMRQIASPEVLPDLTGVPAELSSLVGAMLAYDPAARPGLGTVQERLLTVAAGGDVPVSEVRRRAVQATYDPSMCEKVPDNLDPIEAPDDGASLDDPDPVDGSADRGEPTETAAAGNVSVPGTDDIVDDPAPRPDVTWLADALRRQYARGSLL